MRRQQVQDIYPLSPLQQGMLFATASAPRSGVYLTQHVWTIRGDLDAGSLRRAWQAIVDRHAVLRTCFVWEGQAKPLQVVRRRVEVPWDEQDWRHLSPEDQEARRRLLLEADREKGFDLARGPLMRLRLIRLAERVHVLVWMFHHLLIDGWSTQFLIREVFERFAALNKNERVEPAPVRPYRDYISWLHRQDLSRAEAFWRERLRGFKSPTPLGGGGSQRGPAAPQPHQRRQLRLPPELDEALRNLARRHRLTHNTLCHGAWAFLLSHECRTRDVLFGTVLSGRPAGLEGSGRMVGMFINTVPLRARLPDGATLLGWLRDLQVELGRIREHEHSPLAEVQSWSDLAAGLPLFESAMVYEALVLEDLFEAVSKNGLGLEIESSGGLDQNDLPLTITVHPGVFDFEYDPGKLPPERIDELRRGFVALFELMTERPESSLAALGERLTARTLLSRTPPAPLLARFDRPERARFSVPAPMVPDGAAAPEVAWPANGGSLPLSAAQRWRRWAPRHGLTLAARLPGEPQIPVLLRGLAEVERRHEILRARFDPEEPRQHVAEAGDGFLALVDLTSLPPRHRPRQARYCRRSAADRPSDPGRGPLWRAVVLRTDEGEHQLVLGAHPLIADAWSMGALLRELWRHCRSPAAPRTRPRQYTDFAVWERDWLNEERIERQLAYWRERLRGASGLMDLPTDRPRSAVRRRSGASREWGWPAGFVPALKRFGRRYGVSPFAGVAMSLVALLSRWTGQHDLSLGLPCAGRWRNGSADLIGPLSNTVVVRADLSGDPGVAELAGRLGEAMRGAHENSDLPFGYLVHELAPGSDTEFPFHQVTLVLEEGLEADGLRLVPEEPDSRLPEGDLSLRVVLHGSSAEGLLDYDASLFDATTIRRLTGHLTTLMAAVVGGSEGALSSLPLLSPAQRGQLAVEWNDSRAAYPGRRSFQEIFRAHVEARPQAIAATGPRTAWSYGELDRRSDRVAGVLDRHGLETDQVAGLYAERSLDFLAGILGVLKAGGAYLPLDLGLPPRRLRRVLARAAVRLVLAAPERSAAIAEAVGGLAAGDRPAVLPLAPAAGEAGPARARRGPPSYAESLAFVIFTSGSTGVPKGVMLHHLGVLNHLDMMVDVFGLSARDVVAQTASQTFDISVWQFLVALRLGGRVHVFPDDVVRDVDRLLAEVDAQGVTVLQAVPSVLRVLLDGFGRRWAVAGRGPAAALAGLRWMILCGEALPPDLHRKWFERYPSIPMANAYGPAECSDDVTIALFRQGLPPESTVVPIGRAVGNLRVYVADGALRLAPPGAAGELVIGDLGVGRGYLGDPRRTAESFVPDPWSDGPGSRLYRSGDMARWSRRGSLDFLGREDHQIKLRGIRVELGDVESTLAEHPRLREAVAAVRGSGEPKLLVGYVVARDGEAVTGGELKAWMRDRLPEYMVPSVFVVLESLPLSANGKVDRRALPDPEDAQPEGAAYAAARTPVEEVMCEIWSEVLGHRVGIRDDFFTAGGHSLLAMQVISRLRNAFGVELALRDLIEELTVEGVGRRVERALRAGAGLLAPPIEPASRERDLPLSFGQQRLWFIDQLDPGNSVYNMPLALRASGPLDLAVLSRGLAEVERRHEALRTVFTSVDGTPVQRIRPPRDRATPLVDLAGLARGERESLALALADAEARRPFDLERGRPWRSTVLRLEDEEHVILVTLHHIASDGWSMDVLLREMTVLYGAVLRAEPPPLPALAVQYADFAVWQQSWIQGEVLERLLDYWRRQLSGAPPLLELPTDRPRPAVESFRGSARRLRFTAPLADALRALSQRRGATLFMTLLAGFQALLSRYSGQADVCVGTPVSGRNYLEIEDLIGFFVNTLVLRTDLGGDPTFRDLLARVRETSLAAYTHQEISFEKLVEVIDPERSLSHSPLFQVMLVLDRTGPSDIGLGELRISEVRPSTTTAKFDLTLALTETDTSVQGVVEHNLDLFDGTTVERLVSHLEHLLAAVAGDGELRLSALPLAGAGERWQLLGEWNDTEVSRDGLSVHEAIAAQAARTPESAALAKGSGYLSYAALDRAASRLAGELCSLAVGPETPVGVLSERGPEMVVGLLAVLYAGAAYVPLDPSYPKPRLELMLDDSAAPVVLAERRLLDRLPGSRARRLVLEVAAGAAERPRRVPPESLAYVLYTSGSTGMPKGVAITHGSVAALLRWAGRAFDRAELTGVLASTSICFDLSVFEIFLPLVQGGTVVLVDNLLELCERPPAHRVTLVNTVPSVLGEVLDLAELPDSVRCVNLAGEPLRRSLVDRIYGSGAVGRVLNLYGPSEDTTYSTVAVLSRGRGEEPSIGSPIDGTTAYALDRTARPVPVGVVAELCLGGQGLARGYQGRAALTAARFVPDRLGGTPGSRLYRTGDLARLRARGELEFLGRRDHQVKLRGFRIELGEVEAELAAQAGVRECAVQAYGPRLVAYVVPASPGEWRAPAAQAGLGSRLPGHLVPTAFVTLPALPRTPNGKVDRRALPAPAASGERAGYAAPRSLAEELVASAWSEVLGVDRVGVHESFFELGGHSLLATRVISRLRATFQVELPLRALFEEPTVAALARRVEQARDSGPGSVAPPIERVERRTGLPLSFAQQRLWFLDQLEPERALYNISMALRVTGNLRAPILAACLSEIERRHEVLRTVFAGVDGIPLQSVLAVEPVTPPRVDLSALPPARRRLEAGALAAAEAERPFALERDRPWRALLLAMGAEEHVLSLTLHHIASDAWSIAVLLREVSALYRAYAAGEPSPLPELAVQYADFAVWQRGWLEGGVLERELAYWREQLAGAPPLLELPADRPRPAQPSFRGGERRRSLGPALASGLRELSRRHNSTLFMALTAGFQALLWRYSAQRDVSVGTPIAGRRHLETEGLIGFFVNTLVQRTRLDPEESFSELLGRVREVALDAHAHQDAPFERLVDELEPERDLSRTPLFQVALTLQNAAPDLVASEGLELEPFAAETGTAKFDLSLVVAEIEGPGLEAAWEYSLDLFDGTTVERMARHFTRLLQSAGEDPGRRLSELALVTPYQRAQLLSEWNDMAKEWPQVPLVHERLAAWAERRPDALAVVSDPGKLSYGKLDSRANRLAHHLRRLGVGSEVRVALAMERTLERAVGIVGVLKAGGSYVSLDPTYPGERLAFLLRDCGAPVLLSEQRFLGGLPPCDARVICLDSRWESLGAAPNAPPACGTGPDNLAYVVYTSGSTGRPKGVEISHAGLMNLVRWHQDLYGVTETDHGTQVASPAFDASIWEFWPYLSAGACSHIPDHETRLSSSAMVRWWFREGITLAYLPTPLAEGVLEERIPADLYLRVRALIIGGDRLHGRPRPEVGFRLMNHYGPAEYSIVTTVVEVPALGSGTPTIGRAIDNTRMYVLDRGQRVVPLGVIGELYVAGIGLARGYLRRPGLTGEKFLPDPFSPEPGSRMYRSGDLVRYLPDADMDFLGRLDHQVKVRGLRIELGEIESVLDRHAAVREGVVVVREDRPGIKRLVAYLVGAPAAAVPSAEALRDSLREHLPEYMVPSSFVWLDRLPLTPNGKVDRRALPAPEESSPERAVAYVAPRNPVEDVLAAIWAEILGVERVGIHDSFFELGGHSLLATRAISRLRDTLQVELALRELFEEPTVAGLGRRVEAARRAGLGLLAPPIVPVPRDGELVLSFAQQRLWFIDQLEPGSPLYNVPGAFTLRGPLRLDVLAAALSEVERRHEALRTVFAEIDGRPVQRIRPAEPLELTVVDLSAPAKAEQAARVSALAAAEARRPFDLENDRLWRVTALLLGPREHVLLLTLHHIVCDAWSVEILVREVAALYGARAAGEPSPLPELAVQYADFAAWQRSWLRDEVLEREMAYWRGQLAGAPQLLELSTDRPRPAISSSRGAERAVSVPAPLANRLRRSSQERGVTLFMTLLALFQTLLSRYSGQRDVSVGTPIAGRNRTETEDLIGFFVNTLVLRIRLDGGATFDELVERVREVALEAHTHQDVPFEKLVEELDPERDLSRSPLFQVMLAFQSTPREELGMSGLELESLDIDTGTAKFDLVLSLTDTGAMIEGALEYNTDLFDTTTIARLRRHFEVLSEAVTDAPGRRLGELPLSTPAERHRLLTEDNDTGVRGVRDVCLEGLWDAQVERTPQALAVVFEHEHLSYRELDRRANKLAHHLRRHGVGPDVPVGIAVERSPLMATALLGVLKAGGACVALNPSLPPERLALILEDVAVPVVLTRTGLTGRLDEVLDNASIAARPYLVPLDGDPAAGESAHRPRVGSAPENDYYVIFTSGSTGRPKGIELPRQAMLNLVRWHLENLSVGLRTLQFAPLSFDASYYEMLTAWLSGGTVFMPPEELRPDVAAMAGYLARHRIEKAIFPVVFLQQLAEGYVGGWPLPHSLREVTSTGEQLKVTSAVRELFKRLPALPLHNLYGPSESHAVTDFTLSRDPEAWPYEPPIGKPFDNCRIQLLDRAFAPVALGVAGELTIGGVCLARGYFNRRRLTAEKFVPDPFGEPGSRLYRTGDLARSSVDGNIVFLGRIDHQLKVRGFRVEPGEIESVLTRHPSVGKTVVLLRRTAHGLGSQLVAYCTFERTPLDQAPSRNELQRFLRDRLPEYMVPSAFVRLEAFPLNANGKVDRRSLPAPDAGDVERPETYVAPRSPAEQVVAGIWEEVLGLERVGVSSSFFELGGHSLLATQVISRLRKAFGVDLPLREMFEVPTVGALAERVTRLDRAKPGPAAPPIERVPRDGDLALSFAQQRLWFIDRLEPGSAMYNVPVALRIKGRLDFRALSASLNEVERRHEVLRTVFAAVDGAPVQRILPPRPFAPPSVDLAGLEPAKREALASALADREARRPFDLGADRPWRVTWLQLGPEDRVLLLTLNHIASDGWSIGILVREVRALYGAFAAGKPSPLPELPVQYADFAAWQRRWLGGEVLESELAFWRGQLAGAPPVLELPTDRPWQAAVSARGAQCRIRLTGALTEALKKRSRQRGATLFMSVLAGFKALLARYSGQRDISVGAPIAGRNQVEIEGLIGFFVNVLVLRTDLAGDPGYHGALDRVRKVALEAHAHQDVPFEKLVEELEPERSLAHTPLFQVMFDLAHGGRTSEPGPLEIEPIESRPDSAKFALTLHVDDQDAELDATLEYMTELFDETTALRLVRHWRALLGSALEEPERPVLDLPILARSERGQLLAEWNDTARARPGAGTLHELFEAQAERTPEKLAVVAGRHAMSYLELDRRADRLARELAASGVGPETSVAVFLDRSPRLLVALLGALKAGGAYLPLDPAHPPEKLAFMLEEARVPVLLTESGLLARLPEHGRTVLCLDRRPDRTRIAARGSAIREGRVSSGAHAAYVIYTSGSTGRPKGVVVEHLSAVRYALTAGNNYGITSEDRMLQFASISFDISVEEIFPCLSRGATLVLAEQAMQMSAARFLARCRDWRVTWTSLPTAFWHELAQELGEHPGSLPRPLSRIVIGGEQALAERLAAWRAGVPPDAWLFNTYGPTEATVVASLYRAGAEPGCERFEVPLGRPVANVRAYVLDARLEALPAGAPGELMLAGDGLARGYLARPGATAGRYVPDPRAPEPGGRLYRTGDRACWRPAGRLAFLGRYDHQVKVRGFRVELGEIESALRDHPRLRDALVVARPAEDGTGKRLIAYAVPAHGEEVAEAELRDFLGERLASYMVPASTVFLPSLPRTAAGKVDRRNLPAPERHRGPRTEGFTAPRDAVEERLCRIWEEILEISPIGVRDDFFKLGGHSLLAVRLFARIEKQLEAKLPLHAIFEMPTVERLAGLLREAPEPLPASPLVALRPAGAQRPFFCVHPVGGDVLCYARLSAHLDPDLPFYALRARGLYGEEAPSGEIPEMAGDYLEAVRTVQPDGPYRLGGWSMGGVVAYEMARKLAELGERVELLALFDSVAPDPRWWPEEDELTLLHTFLLDFDLPLSDLGLSVSELLPLSVDRRLERVLEQAGGLAAAPPDLTLETLKRRYEVFLANDRALRAYRPEPAPWRVSLFKATEPLPALGPRGFLAEVSGRAHRLYLRWRGAPAQDPALGWRAWAGGGVRVYCVPGNHFTMVGPPGVESLAETLESCLAGGPHS